MKVLRTLGCLLLGGAFVWAGAMKFLDPLAFAMAVDGYRVFPHAGGYWNPVSPLSIAIWLPWLECILGGMVLSGWHSHAGTKGCLALCVLFLPLLLQAWARGLQIDCGCMGGGGSTSVPLALVRDLVLVALAWWLSRRMEDVRPMPSDAEMAKKPSS